MTRLTTKGFSPSGLWTRSSASVTSGRLARGGPARSIRRQETGSAIVAVALLPVAEPAAARFNAWLERLKGRVLPAAELTDAFVSRQMGDWAREEAAYRRVLERDPGNAQALACFRSPRMQRPTIRGRTRE